MLHIDLSEIHDLARDLPANAEGSIADVQRAVARGGHRVQAQAQVNAPVDTGTLTSSITTDVGHLEFEVGPEVEYGAYVEEGTTGPYPIENAFGWGITAMHPGISPQPYLGPAFDTQLPKTERDIHRAAADGLL